MKICFIADARSPITQNWIRHFVDLGHEVHVISSYPCALDAIPGAKVEMVLFGLSQLSRIRHDGSIVNNITTQNAPSLTPKSVMRTALAHLRHGRFKFLAQFVTNWLVPVDIYRQRHALRKAIERIQPDIVHALRIPREGVAAAYATPDDIPLIISVWGNDFTLWAKKNPLRGHQTRMAMRRVNGLLSDCYRDVRLAREWGLDASIPSLVVPGGGGLDLSLFQAKDDMDAIKEKYDIPANATLVINPRGIRPYVRNDMFFKALKQVVEVCDNVYFLCINMQGNPIVDEWMADDSVRAKVRLLPQMSHSEMAPLYNAADISVTPSEHDGTPNSLLEAMACGCFIVAGNIESVAEWVTDGKNGLMCDPADPAAIAEALISAIQNPELRTRGAAMSRKIIEERADIRVTIPQAEAFYEAILDAHTAPTRRSSSD